MSRDHRTKNVPEFLCRHLATHMAVKVWQSGPLDKVAPGTFVCRDNHWVLVIIGAAPISEVAETALRKSRLLTQLLVLTFATRRSEIYGPRVMYGEERWAEILEACLAATQGVTCQLSIFEYLYANEPGRRAIVEECSAVIAAALPSTTTDVQVRHRLIQQGGWKFLSHNEDGVAALLDRADWAQRY